MNQRSDRLSRISAMFSPARALASSPALPPLLVPKLRQTDRDGNASARSIRWWCDGRGRWLPLPCWWVTPKIATEVDAKRLTLVTPPGLSPDCAVP
jgi:hypothetical protein